MNAFGSLGPWLADALASLEAVAGAGRLGHGWLISGPRHTGKINLAYVVAGRLLAGQIGQSGPPVASPREILAGYAALAAGPDLHPDLHRVRPEEGKRSIAIEQIRSMTAALGLTPHIAGLKVVIIESADSMTTAAANALLKTLEEPTANTYLFLLAERPGRLPATIRSRCQLLPLKAPAAATTAAWLESQGLDSSKAPRAWLARAPLAAARALLERDNKINYNEINDELNCLYEGKIDPYGLADAWHKDQAELALGCLVDSLRARIRRRLVPDRWNPVTDSEVNLTDNAASGVSTRALFEGLETAEQLREQLGRGTNVELALKALLLGLDPLQDSRVKT